VGVIKGQQRDVTPDKPESASDECRKVISSIGAKADKNKRLARTLTLAMTISTAAIPVFIGLSGDNFIFAKVVPSVLAALSAVLVAYNQLERPHERWVLYRRYQRLLQAEETKFRFRTPPYGGAKRKKKLAMQVAQLQLSLQEEWEGLIPRRNEITSAAAIARSGSS